MRRVGPLLLLAALVLGQGVKKDNWLARHQDASGAWKVDGKPDVGATGLSLLAFLAHEYTDRGTIKENRYVAHVRRGLRFLTKHRGANARERAIVTLTLCEAYWMTGNPRYRLPAVNGLAALDGGDDPVTRAFVVAALKSGRFAKLAVPEERLDRERKWLNEHAARNPAAALFSRVILASGDPRQDEQVQQALKLLLREKPRDPLTWYFGTIGTFQVGGGAWRWWNAAMKKSVIETQRPDGSWDGQVEATALYMSCLSVYYRYDRVFGTKDGPEARSTRPQGRSSLAPLTSRIQLDGGDVLDLETVSAEVRVEGFRARVRLSLCFFHGGADLAEGTLQLRLPDGASPHTLAFGSTAGTARNADAALTARAPFRMKTARGEAVAGARLKLRLRAGAETRAWSTTLPAPVASPLTPRVYGEIAVGKLEPFAFQGVGLPEAYARHFRVVRATCSLVMLESEKDYERFGIRAKDGAGVVRRVPVSPWLESRRRATPKQRLRWRLLTLGKPTDLLEHVPDSDFEGLPLDRTADADLALACERIDRPRLGLVYDVLGGGRRRENLCAQILTTGREGFWFEYARKALAVVGHDLVVVLRWDTDNSDVDLHVVDPFGDVCNWRRKASAAGGRLTTDQVHGFGPEIYRLEQAEPGEYVIRVNYFRPTGTTRALVVAIVHGKVVRASVELAQRDQMVEALRVTIPER